MLLLKLSISPIMVLITSAAFSLSSLLSIKFKAILKTEWFLTLGSKTLAALSLSQFLKHFRIFWKQKRRKILGNLFKSKVKFILKTKKKVIKFINISLFNFIFSLPGTEWLSQGLASVRWSEKARIFLAEELSLYSSKTFRAYPRQSQCHRFHIHLGYTKEKLL